MTPTPRELQVVLAIADHGSYTLAAKFLNTTQPALSATIRGLELKLGFPVFQRNAKGASLTEQGALLAIHARTISNLLHQVTLELAASALGHSGPLRIGGTTLALELLIPRALSRLAEKKFSASVVAGLDDALLAQLRAAELDVVVSTIGVDPPEPDIVDEPLIRTPIMIVISPHHKLANRTKLGLEELRDARWALPHLGGSFRRQVEAMFVSANVPFPTGAISSDSPSILKGLVQSGEFIALMPRGVIAVEESAKLLRSISIKGMSPYRMLGARTANAICPPPFVINFLEALRDTSKDLIRQDRSYSVSI